VLGALFDLNFDHMVTVRVVKIIYLLSLVPYSLLALLLVGYGLDWLDQGSGLGLLLIITAPFIWFFLLLGTRIVLEFVINQFKISEYLRAIKDER
jgi:hypothetical protein